MTVNRNRTENRKRDVTVKLKGVELVKVDEWKYLGSTIQEEHAGRVEWVKTSVTSDLRQEDSSKSGRQDLQDGWYTCYDVWFDDGGAVQNTRGQAGDAKNDQNGQSSK